MAVATTIGIRPGGKQSGIVIMRNGKVAHVLHEKRRNHHHGRTELWRTERIMNWLNLMLLQEERGCVVAIEPDHDNRQQEAQRLTWALSGALHVNGFNVGYWGPGSLERDLNPKRIHQRLSEGYGLSRGAPIPVVIAAFLAAFVLQKGPHESIKESGERQRPPIDKDAAVPNNGGNGSAI